MLRISSAASRAVRVGWGPLLANKLHEFWIKGTGRRIKGQGMIGAGADAVRSGFASLAHDGFHEYNLPQRWVESRTIPRVLDGRVPMVGASVLDLGCGPGTSTAMIAHFADRSWRIHGLELVEELVAEARSRAARGQFRAARGGVITPTFFCQSIAETLRDEAGSPIADASVDLALAGGVVGLYMEPAGVRVLADELTRVVKPGGFAALDAGPALGVGELETIMRSAGWGRVALVRSVRIDPRPKVVFVRAGLHEELGRGG